VTWHNLNWLWLLLPVSLVVYLLVSGWRRRSGLRFSNLAPLLAAPKSLAARLRALPLFLRLLALVLVALAVLRPQALMGEEEVKLKGINIMLVLDLSGSMVAEDLKPDRITAAKKVLEEFVAKTRQDQIGLVVFGAKSFTQSPLTLDHEVLRNAISSVGLNVVDADGTAIGDGILTAVNRLREFPGQTNIIVLATDGTNNRGEEPEKAAEIAAASKIRLYIVGIGAKGGAPVYTTDQFGIRQPFLVDGVPQRWEEPNDEALRQLAAKTGGEYYRATDEKALDRIYAKIKDLIQDEKKRRDPHYRELFNRVLLAALLILFFEALLSATWLRSLA